MVLVIFPLEPINLIAMPTVPSALIFLFFLVAPGLCLLRCECDPRYCPETTCLTDGVCFASVKRDDDGTVDRVTRCIDSMYLIPPQRPFLCEFNHRQNHTFVSKCCKDSDLCNKDSILKLAPLPPSMSNQNGHHEQSGNLASSDWTVTHIVALGACALALTTSLLLIFLFAYRRRAPKESRTIPCSCCFFSTFYHEVESCETNSTAATANSTLQDYLSSSMSTGSGSGLPLLVQRSVARQIFLVQVIGKGRFGEVYRGQWRGENVAVKIFSTVDERSWFREVEIYQTVMLRHPNVLGFIAADNKDSGTWTQLWLVTEFVANGSLYDFLSRNTVSPATLSRMCLSVATGLAHLHMEIEGTHGKPAIAHRDLKSKNILVKNGGECVIGDLGLAVRYCRASDTIDLPQNNKVGTKRYLAPEVLLDTLNATDFEAFKCADMYALGLVLWEMASRCHVDIDSSGKCVSEYNLPYYDTVGADPTLEDMIKIVCVDGARPIVPNTWRSEPVLERISKLMIECWYETPAARLTALRVKKTLLEIVATLGSNSTSSVKA